MAASRTSDRQRLVDWINSATAAEFPNPKSQRVLTVEADASIAQCLRVLASANILSAPVRDPEANTYVGMVDLIDIVSYVVKVVKETSCMGEESFIAMEEQGERLSTTLVSEAVDFSKRNPFVCADQDTPLREVLHILAHGVRRVPVFLRDRSALCNIITQSAVVELLARNAMSLGSFGTKTIEELNMGTSPVHSISINARLVDAFTDMEDKRVSALPVVDESGRVVTNVSVKDVRAAVVVVTDVQRLYRTISSFAPDKQEYSPAVLVEAVTCKANTTVGDVIVKLARNRIHRVYVTDDDGKPIRVVSLRDVLRAVTGKT